MAKLAAHNARHWLDEFAMSGFMSAFDQTVEAELIDVTTFNDTGPRRVEGNFDFNQSITAFFDGADNQIDEILATILGDNADHYMTIAPTGGAEGEIAYDGVVGITSHPIQGAIGGAVLRNWEASGRNALVRSTVLRNATISATGAGTGRNIGATTSGQVFAVVARVVSGTFTNLQFDIEESSDDGSSDAYAAISGLSFTFTAAGVQRATVTAATEAWKRVNVTALTGTSGLLVVTAGVVPGT